jgi:hypothetical protein
MPRTISKLKRSVAGTQPVLPPSHNCFLRRRCHLGALQFETDGLVLVYSAFDKSQSRAIENYAKHFGRDLSVRVILVVANKFGESDQKPIRAKMSKQLEKAQVALIDAKVAIDDFTTPFTRFLERVQRAKMQRVESGERALVGENPVHEAAPHAEESAVD